jgi:hypothetical protein
MTPFPYLQIQKYANVNAYTVRSQGKGEPGDAFLSPLLLLKTRTQHRRSHVSSTTTTTLPLLVAFIYRENDMGMWRVVSRLGSVGILILKGG